MPGLPRCLDAAKLGTLSVVSAGSRSICWQPACRIQVSEADLSHPGCCIRITLDEGGLTIGYSLVILEEMDDGETETWKQRP